MSAETIDYASLAAEPETFVELSDDYVCTKKAYSSEVEARKRNRRVSFRFRAYECFKTHEPPRAGRVWHITNQDKRTNQRRGR